MNTAGQLQGYMSATVKYFMTSDSVTKYTTSATKPRQIGDFVDAGTEPANTLLRDLSRTAVIYSTAGEQAAIFRSVETNNTAFWIKVWSANENDPPAAVTRIS